MRTKTKNKIIRAGVGIAALAAASSYFLYGKKGNKNREAIAGWTLKMKGEVLEKMEKIKDLNEDKYYKLVDDVAVKYKRVKSVSATELKHMVKELKAGWAHIKKQV
ncbi:MAG: hypothetical protein U9Q34_00275 [Elusimicrobiota bacterium]|nr:hypothetical protein [Elusimicrobiota bacterium]